MAKIFTKFLGDVQRKCFFPLEKIVLYKNSKNTFAIYMKKQTAECKNVFKMPKK